MGMRIKLKRIEMGLTQDELAAKSGVSRTTISLIERGVAESTKTSTLEKLAKALECTVQEIFFE